MCLMSGWCKRGFFNRPKQSSQPASHVSLDCHALVPRARNDVFSPRHCEGVRRTTEAIQSAGVACFYGLPRSLRSLSWISLSLVAVVDFAALPSTSHSLTGLAPFSRVVRTKIRRNDKCEASLRGAERRSNPLNQRRMFLQFIRLVMLKR